MDVEFALLLILLQELGRNTCYPLESKAVSKQPRSG